MKRYGVVHLKSYKKTTARLINRFNKCTFRKGKGKSEQSTDSDIGSIQIQEVRRIQTKQDVPWYIVTA